ncbi:LAME_0H16204g1_1 [Lachancea meyersii CBS 8951]|uniref:LAME_0H16204g1_1 n=1 Tax=Lachancea meyersii CBS 8951 TaxID=1266667 RepID=A0A1G4KIB0_9SACH|nr:LAME_0H16204g1_1 [Lachancea meyersii CBS 8951]
MTVKPGILFIAEPNWDSPIYNTIVKDKFQVEHYDLHSSNSEDFLDALKTTFNSSSKPLSAIYGGFMGFNAVGGLTRGLLEDERFPSDTLKCVVLCSRGVNGIDFDAVKEHGIEIYNYSDEDEGTTINGFKTIAQAGLVSDDVANCALWHVLEGYRKFSFHQMHLRKTGHTFRSRSRAAGEGPESKEFMFGHTLTSLEIKSPRGRKALILGLGGIGKQIASKLQNGLGMEVHYAKRSCDPTVSWPFHKLDSLLYPHLSQFDAIVIALPGTPETRHLVNHEFLSSCSEELILVNIGRGTIIDPEAISEAKSNHRIRHLGLDVYYHEPEVEDWLLEDNETATITPHIGSGTKNNFDQSCEYALGKALSCCFP